ncbi:xylulokinase [Rhodotorula paludigena]|uniref:xylulokinase n=1 Tax=Rhodotorula paludigena TaxID=86838 RepID=UPI00316E8EA0
MVQAGQAHGGDDGAAGPALKASFVDNYLESVAEYGVRFDEDLPHFKTTSGVHVGSNGVVTSPVAMWLEAVDLLFDRIARSEGGAALLRRVKAVSGAGQQHASVYWSAEAPAKLAALDPSQPLAAQLTDSTFTSPVSPNWQDSSTTKECRDMEGAIGGEEVMAHRTGSRANERFTGPQILKLRRTQPDVYDKTDRISLVSSFLTSIFCADGEIKPMEESDACGANLWNLEADGRWDPELLEYVAGGKGEAAELERKLGQVEKDGGVAAGKIGRWFIERYGMDPDCLVNHFTGDNNATILSFSLHTGEVVVSLGTSDTILLSTTEYAPSPDSHVFSYPANRAGGGRSYMGMLCYKNGSLSREYVRDRYAEGSWETFSRLVEEAGVPTVEAAETRPIGFYFLKHEIIPHNGYGVHHFEGAEETAVDDFSDPSFNARAVLESQFLSFRHRMSNMLFSSTGLPVRIYAVGGASANQCIKDTLATVLAAPVFQSGATSSSANSCSLGGCMKAYWAYARLADPDLSFEDAVHRARAALRRKRGEGAEREPLDRLVAEPDYGATLAYDKMMARLAELEKRVCV